MYWEYHPVYTHGGWFGGFCSDLIKLGVMQDIWNIQSGGVASFYGQDVLDEYRRQVGYTKKITREGKNYQINWKYDFQAGGWEMSFSKSEENGARQLVIDMLKSGRYGDPTAMTIENSKCGLFLHDFYGAFDIDFPLESCNNLYDRLNSPGGEIPHFLQVSQLLSGGAILWHGEPGHSGHGELFAGDNLVVGAGKQIHGFEKDNDIHYVWSLTSVCNSTSICEYPIYLVPDWEYYFSEWGGY